ncbi:MAG: hypothetical protein R2854_09320 [Caldilineaceae bacterium]
MTKHGTLRAWNFRSTASLVDGCGWFDVSRNGKKLVYRNGMRLRVIDAGEKPSGSSGHPRKTGWIDLGRVKVAIEPQSEWEQMFREAWRLQRDQFWTEDMSEVDWSHVHDRYFPLINRVSTRSEFSDLMWEMQGELGTSPPRIRRRLPAPATLRQGYLGAALTWDAGAGGYRIGDFVVGDPWDMPPFVAPGRPGCQVRGRRDSGRQRAAGGRGDEGRWNCW